MELNSGWVKHPNIRCLKLQHKSPLALNVAMISCVCQQRNRKIKREREKLGRTIHHKYVQQKTIINRVESNHK